MLSSFEYIYIEVNTNYYFLSNFLTALAMLIFIVQALLN